MTWLDRWPSTPAKLFTAWVFSIVFFLVSLVVMVKNMTINETVFYVLAVTVLGADAVAAKQFKDKRATAWQPPATPSEAGSIQHVDAVVAERVQERVEAAAPVVAAPVAPAASPMTRDD